MSTRTRRVLRTLGIVLMLLAAGLVAGYTAGNQPAIDLVAEGERKLGIPLRSQRIQTNGIRLHVVRAGPEDGPPVLLLHGFPEFWWGWSAQIAPLAAAGYHVIVPDQRGYNASDKPEELEAYRMEDLERDIVGLIERLGYEDVYLAGHDLGGSVAWHLALEHPGRVRKLAVFSSPHPLALQEAKETPSEQETIRWYRSFFQLPWLPEFVAKFGNWAIVARSLQATSREGTFAESELDYYRYAWDRDGAMSSMIDGCRAGLRYPRQLSGDGKVRVPTLIVWGLKDAYLEPRLARLSLLRCEEATLLQVHEAGHWLLHEEPDYTSRLLIGFFSEDDKPPA